MLDDHSFWSVARQILSLETLERKSLPGGYALRLEIRPKKVRGRIPFELYLTEKAGRRSRAPIFRGLYSKGPTPASNWIDGDYHEQVEFDGLNINVSSFGLDEDLFKVLARVIPQGGSLMVSYELLHGAGKTHTETSQLLELGCPSVCTPLGYLLYRAGCTAGFRDWYFPEGGSEGPRKLQAFKPASEEQAKQKAEELIEELEIFLKGVKEDSRELIVRARSRALELIKILKA